MRELIRRVGAVAAIWFSAAMCCAQTGDMPVADEAYLRELSQLVERLQRNPWSGWDAGTSVTVRYSVERDTAGKALGREQPDIIFRITERDKSLETTELVKGKPVKREFAVKDQPGLDTSYLKDSTPAVLISDGLRVDCLVSESVLRELPVGSTLVTKEWRLASQPSIVVRKEFNGHGWQVTSTRVTRTVAGKDFSCVEIKRSMMFYAGGPALAETTEYLCPEVPGHMTEKIEQFFKVKKGLKSSTPFQIVHQKVVDINLSPATQN